MPKQKQYKRSRDLGDRVLNAEEEIVLGRIIREATPNSEEYNKAFKELIDCNLRLVAKEAYEISKKTGLDAEDLMNEGYIGLDHAIEKYDPDKFSNARFATYALHWIRQRMYGYLHKNQVVYIPRNVLVQVSQYNRLLGDHGEGELTREDIISKLGITESELKLIEYGDVKPCSISSEGDNNDVNSNGSKKQSLADLLQDESDDPARVAVLLDRSNIVEKLLESYPAREKDIVMSYLMDEEKVSLQEMAKKYKLSRERIRQIKEKVLRDMRNKLLKMKFESTY